LSIGLLLSGVCDLLVVAKTKKADEVAHFVRVQAHNQVLNPVTVGNGQNDLRTHYLPIAPVEAGNDALQMPALRAGLTSYPAPEVILTDNGTQNVTWRGKSQFSRELEKRGIKQQALARAAQRTLGLAPPAAASARPSKNGTKRRQRRPTARGLRAATRLHAGEPIGPPAPTGINAIGQSSRKFPRLDSGNSG
jgi:hypothetical protein